MNSESSYTKARTIRLGMETYHFFTFHLFLLNPLRYSHRSLLCLALLIFFNTKKKYMLIHPLELPEILSRITITLGRRDLASYARACLDWNFSFTLPLYDFVICSEKGSPEETLERNRHLIRHLAIRASNNRFFSTPAESVQLSSVMNELPL